MVPLRQKITVPVIPVPVPQHWIQHYSSSACFNLLGKKTSQKTKLKIWMIVLLNSNQKMDKFVPLPRWSAGIRGNTKAREDCSPSGGGCTLGIPQHFWSGVGIIPGLWIRIHFIRIRIQHFLLITDPVPLRILGFNDQKLQLKKN
jgi:hypothetical protein